MVKLVKNNSNIHKQLGTNHINAYFLSRIQFR